jgi:hypothetical protein
MVRAINLMILCLLTVSGFTQVVQERNARGADRIIILKDGFRVPIRDTATAPALLNYSGDSSRGGVVYDSTLQKLCFWTGVRWVCLDDSATGGSIDTTSLSNRINLKLNISDTTTMNANFLVGIGAGTNITVDNTNPRFPVVSASGGGGGVPGGGQFAIQYSRDGAFAGNQDFVYDTISRRVGIGITPENPFHIRANNTDKIIRIRNEITTGYTTMIMEGTGAVSYQFGVGGATAVQPSDRTYRNSWYLFDSLNATATIISQPNSYLHFPTRAGIGNIQSPNTLLHIRSSSDDLFRVENTGATGYANMRLTGVSKTYQFGLGNGSTPAFFRNAFYVFDETRGASPFHITTNGETRLTDGTNLTTTYPSALLGMLSTTRGFLRPVLTTTQRNAISSPANGLSIYNSTDGTNDLRVGTAWYNQPNGLKASATLDFPDTGAQLSADLTITVTGAAVGDIVMLGTPVQLANSTYTAFVSAANTVTVRLNNYSAGNINPASGTFKVYVIKN